MSLQRDICSWIRAFRPPAQINLALPMLVGIVHRAPCPATLENLPLLRGLAISLLLQAMILYSNDASDAATDDTNARTMISGGSGVGAEEALSPKALQRAAFIAGGIGLIVCGTMGGVLLACLWLLAALLVWAYDGQTLRLSRHPLGSLCQAAGVGIVAPLLGGWCAASPSAPTIHDLAIGLCLGISGHILTALPDEAIDRSVGKNTIVVCLGSNASFTLMMIGLASAALLLTIRSADKTCASFQLGRWSHVLALATVAGLLATAWRLRQSTSGLRARLTPDLWFVGIASILLWAVWIMH